MLSPCRYIKLRLVGVLDYRAKQLSDTPRLCDAAAGCVGRIAVEDFGDLGQAGFVEMRFEVVEPRSGEVLSGCVAERS